MRTNIILSVFVLPLASVVCSAQTEITNEGLVYTVNEDGTSVTLAGMEAGNDATVLSVPETVEGYSVTAVGDDAFSGNKVLTQVVLPATVTEIGARAFYECISLTDATLGEGTSNIGDAAFHKCGGLSDIVIPSKTKSIGSLAFAECSLDTVFAKPTVPPVLPILSSGFGSDVFSGSEAAVLVVPFGCMMAYMMDMGWGTFYPVIEEPEPVIPTPPSHEDNLGNVVYELSTADDLLWFAGKVNDGETELYAELQNDIVMNELVFDGGELQNDPLDLKAWTPVGQKPYAYTGVFDGKGYTISGLYISQDYGSRMGFIGENGSMGTIRNLCIRDAYVSAYSDMGALCGYNDGTIDSCSIAGTVVVKSEMGSMWGGGLCGSNFAGVLRNSHSTADVWFSSITNAGAICGYSAATLRNCYNLGNVTSDMSVAAICGSSDYSKVENCYNLGNVTSAGEGYFAAGILSATSGSELNYCYNYGTVSALADENANPILTEASMEKVSSTFYLDGCVNGYAGNDSITAMTEDEFLSGEVAYRLQAAQTTATWGQLIGTDTVPVLYSTVENKVYRIELVADTAVMDTMYANSGNFVLPEPEKDKYEFLGWFDAETGGTQYEDNAVLESDITLYAQWKKIGIDITNEGLVYTVNEDGTSVTLAGMEAGNDATVLSVPETVEGYSVTAVGDDAFSGNKVLTQVVLPATVTEIGARAFYECISLTDATLGEGTSNIGDAAFHKCGGLSDIVIPSKTKSIGSLAFAECSLDTVFAKPTVPPVLPILSSGFGSDVFSGSEAAVLVVPFGCMMAYMMDMGWGTFYPVIEEPEPVIPTPPSHEDNLGNVVYELSTADDLLWFAGKVNDGETELYAELQNDIVMNELVFDGGELQNDPLDLKAWTPVGQKPYAYTGVFDGKGYTISGLYISQDYGSRMGFIGENGSMGTIRNLCIRDAYVSAYSDMGALCGYNDGTIDSCSIAGTVVVKSEMGSMWGGGLCGSNFAGVLRNSHSTADVWFSSITNAGAICGYSAATLRNCYNLGNVTSDMSVAAICGSSDYSKVENCYNLGNVTSAGEGYFAAGILSATSGSELNYCYNYGTVSALADENANPILTEASMEKVSSTFYLDGCVNGYAGNDSITAMTEDEFLSGEVAYRLQAAQTTATWGQLIGTDTVPVLYSTVENKVYRIELVADTAVMDTMYANSGNFVLPEPEKDKYEFLGWFDAETGGTQYEDNAVLESDITLYAQWKKIGIDMTGDEAVRVYAADGAISVENAAGLVRIYAADGTKVYEGLDAEIAVDGGVYIVVTADVVNKVVVR